MPSSSSEVAWIQVAHSYFRIFNGNSFVDPSFSSKDHHEENDFSTIVINAQRSLRSSTLSSSSNSNSSSSVLYVQDPQQHVRELAHLESQMKILLQQNNQGQSVTTTTKGVQTECLSFYERLLNPPTFVWPDFVTIILTKLAEYFVTIEDVNTRETIVQIFQAKKAFLSQIQDSSKLLGHVTGLFASLKDPSDEEKSTVVAALALDLLETMPTLLIQDSGLQQEILDHLSPQVTSRERLAAIAAAKALSNHSESFQKDLFQYLIVLKKNQLVQSDASFEVLELFAYCKSRFGLPANIGKAYRILEEMYTNSCTTADQAMTCLDALTQLVIVIMGLKAGKTINEAIMALQDIQSPEKDDKVSFNFLQLVDKFVSFLKRQVLEQDPRRQVQTFALVLLKRFIDSCPNVVDLSVLLKEKEASNERNVYVFLSQLAQKAMQLNAESQEIHQHQQLAGFQLYQSLCKFQVPSNLEEVLKNLRAMIDACESKQQEQIGLLYVQVLSTCLETLALAKDHEDNLIVSLLGKLLEILKDPVVFDQLPNIWSESLAVVKNIALTSPSDGIASCLMELALDIGKLKQNQSMEEKLVLFISHLASIYREEIQPFKANILEYLSSAELVNKKTLMAYLMSFFQAFRGEEDQVLSFLSLTKHLSLEEKYQLGQEATLDGHFEIALHLLETLPERFDDEHVVYWIKSLLELVQAERKIVTNGTVSLDVVASMTKSLVALRAASSSSYTYIFQQKMIQLRLELVTLIQKTQQLAGELAFIYGTDSGISSRTSAALSKHQETKVKQLSTSYQKLAEEFEHINSALYGCDPIDKNLFEAYHCICICMSYGINGFLGLEPGTIKKSQPSSSMIGFVPLIEASFLLQSETLSKVQELQRLAPSTGIIGLGAQVLLALVESINRLPFVMPRMFFRLKNQKKKLPQLSMEAQFLTFAEKNSFVAKPRVRSQVGLPLGTSLSCFLQGVLVVDLDKDQEQQSDKQVNDLLSELDAIEVELHIQQEETTNIGTASAGPTSKEEGTTRYVPHKVSIPIDLLTTRWWRNGQYQVLIPIDSPVLISSDFLTSKGSFVLRGTVTLVGTTQDNKWIIGSTRTTGTGKPIFPLQRGFIVY